VSNVPLIDNSNVADARNSVLEVILKVTADMSILATLKKQNVVPALILATKSMNIAMVAIHWAL